MFNIKDMPEGKYEVEIKDASDEYIWKQNCLNVNDLPFKLPTENAKDIWIMFEDNKVIVCYQEKAGNGATSVTIKPINGTTGPIAMY